MIAVRPAGICAITLLAVLGLARPAVAQYPRARTGQFEVRGMDFSASGAWRKRVNAIRTARHDFIKAGSIRSLNLNSATAFGGTRVTGHFVIPVVPIAFPNAPAPYTTAQLQDQLFSPLPIGRPYTLKTFYEQMSNGNITMDGTVFPWVVAPNVDSYYEDGCNGIGVRNRCLNGGATGVDRFASLLIGALNTASNGPDAATVWAGYDNDGPDGISNSG
ncbi:MAG: hypothetical protein H0U85_07810, partial [Gemmatimonadales bacterium]|nr:hypothetical protein [Gemmatimonadales bacterium]